MKISHQMKVLIAAIAVSGALGGTAISVTHAANLQPVQAVQSDGDGETNDDGQQGTQQGAKETEDQGNNSETNDDGQQTQKTP